MLLSIGSHSEIKCMSSPNKKMVVHHPPCTLQQFQVQGAEWMVNHGKSSHHKPKYLYASKYSSPGGTPSQFDLNYELWLQFGSLVSPAKGKT